MADSIHDTVLHSTDNVQEGNEQVPTENTCVAMCMHKSLLIKLPMNFLCAESINIFNQLLIIEYSA